MQRIHRIYRVRGIHKIYAEYAEYAEIRIECIGYTESVEHIGNVAQSTQNT